MNILCTSLLVCLIITCGCVARSTRQTINTGAIAVPGVEYASGFERNGIIGFVVMADFNLKDDIMKAGFRSSANEFTGSDLYKNGKSLTWRMTSLSPPKGTVDYAGERFDLSDGNVFVMTRALELKQIGGVFARKDKSGLQELSSVAIKALHGD